MTFKNKILVIKLINTCSPKYTITPFSPIDIKVGCSRSRAAYDR